MGDALGTVGHTIAGIPGGARDLLIGGSSADRSGGEQFARALATLLAGENVGAQVAMRKQWSEDDRAYRAAPFDPIYQEIARTRGPEGIKEFFGSDAPPLAMAPQRLPPGIAGPPDPTPQPVLPPFTSQQLKNEIQAQGIGDFFSRLDDITPLAQFERTVSADPKGLKASVKDRDLGVASFPQDVLEGTNYQAHGFRLAPTNRVDARGVPMVILERDPATEAGKGAFERKRGERRAEYTPLDGTTAAPTTGAAPPTAGVAPVAPTPGAGPAPVGAPSLSIDEFPGATPADLELIKKDQLNTLQLAYEKRKKLDEAKLKLSLLSDDDRKRLGQIHAARAFLDTYRDYGLDGDPGDDAAQRPPIPSTLPPQRVSGMDAITEMGRQSELYQSVARDPFLQGLQRYQAIGRPILWRNLGGDVGNITQTEQEAIGSVLSAASKPEVDDAVRQMRGLIDAREKEIVRGKLIAGGAAANTGASAGTGGAYDLGHGFSLRVR